jgi:hypothetical protein
MVEVLATASWALDLARDAAQASRVAYRHGRRLTKAVHKSLSLTTASGK